MAMVKNRDFHKSYLHTMLNLNWGKFTPTKYANPFKNYGT